MSNLKNPSHSGLPSSLLALTIAHEASEKPAPILVITESNGEALHLVENLQFFLGDKLPVIGFPDWEILPYDTFSPHREIVSTRLRTLQTLSRLQTGIVVVAASTLMHRLAPRTHLDRHSLFLECGETFGMEKFSERLIAAGYQRVGQVVSHGEFALRGSLFDLFPLGSPQPYRIDRLDDTIESIRSFDPDNQRSLKKFEKIELLPAHEFPLDEDGIAQFRQQWRETLPGNPLRSSLYQSVNEAKAASGLEYYLPLFFENTSTLLDYLPENSKVIRAGNIADACDRFWHQVKERYDQLSGDLERPILPPKTILLPPQDLLNQVKSEKNIAENNLLPNFLNHISPNNKVTSSTLPDLRSSPRSEKPLKKLSEFLKKPASKHTKTIFCVESAGRQIALRELLAQIDIRPQALRDWYEVFDAKDDRYILVGPLNQGFMLPSITVITENELLGHIASPAHRVHHRQQNPELMIKHLMELHIGDPVVHVNHGIARYLGLQNLNIEAQEAEFIVLEYAENDKLYVPVTSLHLISRYNAGDADKVSLHRLGGESWEKSKRKAMDKIRDAAAELLAIYAQRAARPGHAFPTHDEAYHRFAAAFPYDETPDQAQTIESVLEDMKKPKPMDRLVCGDVGFGKTEVALRAAFVAVNAGKQVVLTVPTTLLAKQHEETFRTRFAEWPVSIEGLSRFKTAKEQDAIIEKMAQGQIDIIIGTHKLLQPGIQFKSLGLLIIDEEHRFGVQQKEQLKRLRAETDVLTLTATPIPRTLNMAFSGLREISLITTPPNRRLAVKTFVRPRNQVLIREAIERELLRGGQVYFIHNRVETIQSVAEEIQELVPRAQIAVAHGQMPERTLERIMHDFYHQKTNVLVSTTIIESGIDIPSANTIVIDRADMFGLAQLHQMRGRVGRSHHQAYAYLMTRHEKAMTPDAKKRLAAIGNLEELGAGFMLANHDLEIRGAGELLGEQQSGQIEAIGFDLYLSLLERAVAALKRGEKLSLDMPWSQEAEVELQIPALLPEHYIHDVHTRLVLYKRIANAENTAQLDALRIELIDRFGLLAKPCEYLFEVTALKFRARSLGIKKIEASARGGRFHFDKKTTVEPIMLIKLIQLYPKKYQLDGGEALRFRLPTETPEERLDTITQLLDWFEKKESTIPL